MAEPDVALGERDLERIGDYVRGHLGTWLGEVAPLTVSAPQLLERAVRIESELKSQRELMLTKFEASDRRFEDLTKRLDQRFEDMGSRFEDMTRRSDKRFEGMGTRLAEMTRQSDKRFEDMGTRFEDLTRHFDRRFGDMNRNSEKRFEDINKRIGGMQWLIGIGMVMLGTMMSLYQFLA